MYKIVYIAFLIAFCFNARSASAQDRKGYLTVLSTQPLDSIIIDDSAYALTAKIPLSPGEHTVMIRQPNRASFQALDFIEKVTIREREEEKVTVRFELLSEVNSYPSGVSVYAGSEQVGITPFYLPLNERKGSTLLFKKPGYEDLSLVIADSTIQKNFIFVSLQPKIKSRSNNQNQFVNLEWQERGPHKHKNALWISNSLGILCGAGAAFYKKKADDSFEKAKVARRLGNIDDREKYLNRTRKYDRYSAIGFVGMQVNVVVMVYFFFKSR